MKVYLVGGAVRDKLLGLPVADRDWVVVGASEEEMLAQNYQRVGKDFPVFLHPETKEEYALARKERKTGKGYGGFDFETGREVSLEEDLSRRDLTINAIAQDLQGGIVDPYGGRSDLAHRKLRHVSPAFREDPLRILRVARFYARFYHLGFEVDLATQALMHEMIEASALQELVADRLWVEFAKGLSERSPQAFVGCLLETGALESLLPALAKSLQATDNYALGEPNTLKRIKSALQTSEQHCLSVDERWAVLCHAVGFTARPRNLLLSPPEKVENPDVARLCETVKAPKLASRLAVAANVLLPSLLAANRLKPDYILQLLELCDAFRQSSLLEPLMRIANSINATSPDQPSGNLCASVFLLDCQRVCLAIDSAAFARHGLEGAEVGEAIRVARKIAIAELLKE